MLYPNIYFFAISGGLPMGLNGLRKKLMLNVFRINTRSSEKNLNNCLKSGAVETALGTLESKVEQKIHLNFASHM